MNQMILPQKQAEEGFVCSALSLPHLELPAISPQVFTDEVCFILYNVYRQAKKAGRTPTSENINGYLEASPHFLARMQEIAKDRGLSPDQWTNFAFQLGGSVPSQGLLVDMASDLVESYADRQRAEVGRLLVEGELDQIQAVERLQKIAATSGGRADEMLASLDERKFNHITPPGKPVPLFSIGEAVIATAGNIIVLSAQAKAGKSAFLSGLIGAALAEDVDDELTFGVKGKNTSGKAILHFDTEQSRYDHYALVERAIRRGGLSAPPAFLRSYCLTDVDIRDRREMLRVELARCADIGIYAVMLDGVADFVADPNDPEESFSFVAELHRLAIKYDCAIVGVLHENPGTDYGKTRGHLGSQLERKAETNLRMVKDANDITTVWTEKARHCSLPKTKGIRFAYDTGRGCHVLVESANEARASVAQDELAVFSASVFEGVKHGLAWHELRDKIIELAGISVPGAKKKIERMAEAGTIQKTLMNRYELSA